MKVSMSGVWRFRKLWNDQCSFLQVHGCGSSSTSGGKSPSHGYDSEGEDSNSSSERSISVSAMSPHHANATDPLAMPDHRVSNLRPDKPATHV